MQYCKSTFEESGAGNPHARGSVGVRVANWATRLPGDGK